MRNKEGDEILENCRILFIVPNLRIGTGVTSVIMNHYGKLIKEEKHPFHRSFREGFCEGVKFSVSMGKIFFDKNQICIIVLFKFLVFCCRIIYLIIVLPIRLRLYLNFKIFCSTNSGISNPFFVGSAHTRPQE